MAQEITVDDLTPAQREAYDTLIYWFKEGYFDAFYSMGRQSGKTTVLNLAVQTIKEIDEARCIGET